MGDGMTDAIQRFRMKPVEVEAVRYEDTSVIRSL